MVLSTNIINVGTISPVGRCYWINIVLVPQNVIWYCWYISDCWYISEWDWYL